MRSLLAAEQRNDLLSSYRLLSPAGHKRYGDLADWRKRASQLPPITSFTIGAEHPASVDKRRSDVVVEVTHKPGLDPFVGLSAAHERQTWVARRQTSGWLVDPDPQVSYELPPDSRAATAALSWARAVQACDSATAARFQGVDDLFGSATGAAKLCRSHGTVTTGEVSPLQAGPSSADLIAQYSTDALAWARTVRIDAASGRFSVILAPIGDGWKIIGLTD